MINDSIMLDCPALWAFMLFIDPFGIDASWLQLSQLAFVGVRWPSQGIEIVCLMGHSERFAKSRWYGVVGAQGRAHYLRVCVVMECFTTGSDK